MHNAGAPSEGAPEPVPGGDAALAGSASVHRGSRGPHRPSARRRAAEDAHRAPARRARAHRFHARRRAPPLRVHGGTGGGRACRPRGGSRPGDVLARTIERELNLPFVRDGRLNPFRFFCIDSGPWFHLGLAYDHVIAGGDSIVVLLEGIFSRYLGDKPEAPPVASPRPLPGDLWPAACPARRPGTDGHALPADDRGQLRAHRAAARPARRESRQRIRVSPPRPAGVRGARRRGARLGRHRQRPAARDLAAGAGTLRRANARRRSAGTNSPSRRSSIFDAIWATIPTSPSASS